jgi:hypothetical protein
MTNPRFRDFGAGNSVSEPLSFKIHGEEFHCKPALQGKVLLDMVSASQSESANEGAVAAGLIETFFAKALLEESLVRFRALLEDPQKIVTVETLGELTAWLVEQYSGRPMQGPEDSLSGQ